MREVVIAGVGIHKFGRYEDKSLEQMGQEAVLLALKDSNNMDWNDVQLAFCGTMFGGTAAGHRILSRVGLTGIPIINLETACASGGTAIMLGAQAISAGYYDVIMVLGVEKMPRGFMAMTSYPEWQMLSGLALNPVHMGLTDYRAMVDRGVTSEHLAKISVKSHKNGALNPYAMYQKEVTMEEVLNSKMVCYPLRLLMLCAPNEGAAAVVLCSKDVAKKYTDQPITVASACIRVGQYGTNYGMVGTGFMCDSAKIVNPEVTTLTAKEAYEKAGIGPEDLDVVELQDTDAGMEINAYEELMLCKPGESIRFVEEGITEIGGDLPVNTSGGLLSKGEPVGASGLGQIVEMVWQLRGKAGPRQVPDAKVGMCEVNGAGGNCAVTILKR